MNRRTEECKTEEVAAAVFGLFTIPIINELICFIPFPPLIKGYID
jgi:hypothetical protein